MTSARVEVGDEALAAFLPPVEAWFRAAFAAPSPAQTLAWPVIRRGESTLLLAPTGSGKTLAAFLCALDRLYRRAAEDALPAGIDTLYLTPLKALGNDIHKNLTLPLAGIRALAPDLPELRIAVRTGDTPAAERARMARQPPQILITTPESLYLLLGSESMAPALSTIRTVIVDEVHALCETKRGVHLAVSLERLEERVAGPLQRVGCSATLHPIEAIAAFLAGCDADGRPRPCTIVNAGQRKSLDLGVATPVADLLEAGGNALWSSAYARLLQEVEGHRTTLIFCNSRYKAERTVLRLREQSADAARIGVHHGSMAKETRLTAEDELKSGALKALVATASLELGIDVGAVDLVYQLESPKTVATALQRVGRAGHLLEATSKGRMLLFDRDELLEAAAIARAMRRGEVDAVRMPRGCLDVLAQQLAGAVAAEPYQADALFALVRRAHPYTDLPRESFDQVVAMLAAEHPFDAAHPPKPLLLWDRAAGRLSPTRSAAHVCSMNVGTIAENAEYEVYLATTQRKVGTVQSEFVDDCLRTGDVFVLGSTSWRVAGKHRNRLLVEEAPGSTPTVPWWLGPVEPRSAEVGRAVGELRREVVARLDDPGLLPWLSEEYCLEPEAAEALAEYVREQQAIAGVVPDHETLLAETWRDELGRQNVILHTPFGQRLHKTWGVALAAEAKRRHQDWSVTASNDAVLLARGGHDHEPVDAAAWLAAVTPATLPELLAESAAGVVTGGTAFRDVSTCALQVLRAWQGKRVPLWLQNHRAQELFDAVGPHWEYPVVAEVLRGYLHDQLDHGGLAALLAAVAEGRVAVVHREVESPSPFAHALLLHDRYADDHQMGRDRRAHLLRLHRRVLAEVLSTDQMAELLDPRATATLERRLLHRSEATRARTSDELAQAIRDLGDVPAREEAFAELVEGDAAALLASLRESGRVVGVELPTVEQDPVRYVAADLWRMYHDAFGLDGPVPDIPERWRQPWDPAEARTAVVDRYLRCRGPVTLYELANHTGWAVPTVEAALATLVDEGKAVRGVYTREKPRPQWVNRANLEEIHRLTLGYLKHELGACAPHEAVDFVTRWQHVHPKTRLRGLDGLRQVIAQLQGLEVMQGALESELLPSRVADYAPDLLDRLIASGEVVWRRVSPQRLRRGLITLCLRRDAAWLAAGTPVRYTGESEADADIRAEILAVRDYFARRGNAYFDDLLADLGMEEGPATRAVWHLAWCGELTCDRYEGLRHADFQTTLSACYDLDSTPRKILDGRVSPDRVLKQLRRRRMDPRLGRWWATERLVAPAEPLEEAEVARRWAEQLLARWGVLTRDLVDGEPASPPWSALLPELKRRELLGELRRGYFIDGHHGEQYGLPEAIELLRDCRARRGDGLGWLPDEPLLALTNRDPANLYTHCLAALDERGEPFEPTQRSGNLTRWLVLQAGQVLLYGHHQLVTLDRSQLRRCIELLQPAAGHLLIRRWNGAPVEQTAAAEVLGECGFRYYPVRELYWPPRKETEPAPVDTGQQVFEPYFVAERPQGLAYVLSKASDKLRPLLAELLPFLEAELGGRGWELSWGEWGLNAHHQRKVRLGMYFGRTFVYFSIRTHTLLVDGEKRRLHRHFKLSAVEELTDEVRAQIATAASDAEALYAAHVAGKPRR